MKVAVLSESPADEAAIRILIDGILGRPTQPADMPPIRTRGVARPQAHLIELILVPAGNDIEPETPWADGFDGRSHAGRHRWMNGKSGDRREQMDGLGHRS